jgi:endonuclease/exonuclease/phosphatase family metal-dependent hydrolase
VAILAKQSADGAWAEIWKSKGTVDPPRGFAFAVIPFGKNQVGFYSVHLKSNLVRGDAERQNQLNILKRELAAEQLVDHSVKMKKDYPGVGGFVVAGDFNTNRDQDLFVSERTLEIFESARFTDPLRELPLASRVTHPGTGRYPDATFDYVLAKGLKQKGAVDILPNTISDHRPVTTELEIP